MCNPFKPQNKHQSAGFTIVELLVATIIFSVVLLLITAGILQVARVYYKGITEMNTQNAARNIIDTISQSIQFSGGTVTPADGSRTAGTAYAFCIGNLRFSYQLGYQVEDTSPSAAKHQMYHGLVQDTPSGAPCSGATPAQNLNAPVSGKDMIGQHMRLSNLVVRPIAGTSSYEVKVRVVYGDYDLLFSPDPSAPAATDDTYPDAKCLGVRAGTQFCAAAELSTVVQKRVE
ncbi:MAG TPA: prepilin-type N-terminal cleavage/methylation domain-containing protein [Candidatus Saccharimonadales bacterium]|nr:prepilin-type N-terminal cleavage/methylation domain-containing protein [Candidatus Saccharimonadales bacterium]